MKNFIISPTFTFLLYKHIITIINKNINEIDLTLRLKVELRVKGQIITKINIIKNN